MDLAGAAAEVREEFGVQPYVERPETALTGVPHLVDVGTITCPCGEYHAAEETAYGLRAQCEEFMVRWTCLNVDTVPVAALSDASIRVWTAEPYVMMSARSTTEEETRK